MIVSGDIYKILSLHIHQNKSAQGADYAFLVTTQNRVKNEN